MNVRGNYRRVLTRTRSMSHVLLNPTNGIARRRVGSLQDASVNRSWQRRAVHTRAAERSWR